MRKIIIKEAQLKNLVKHLYQPDGISCGPTCIKMVGEFYKGNIDSIADICKYCETDNIIGTTPERMRKGLNKLQIDYTEHIDEENPFDSLRNIINNGSIGILRTFTRGIPHWIVVYDYNSDDNGLFYVNDPWLGQLVYDEKELNHIWKDRNYYFIEITKNNKKINIKEEKNNIIYRKYNPNTDEKQVIEILEDIYKKTNLNGNKIWGLIQPIDNNLSIVVEIENKVVGFYFLREEKIPETDSIVYKKLSKLKGLEGVALGLLENYWGLGIGKKLIEYPKSLGYDYIWGYQLKNLENINDWLKRRNLYDESEGMYITYQIF